MFSALLGRFGLHLCPSNCFDTIRIREVYGMDYWELVPTGAIAGGKCDDLEKHYFSS